MTNNATSAAERAACIAMLAGSPGSVAAESSGPVPGEPTNDQLRDAYHAQPSTLLGFGGWCYREGHAKAKSDATAARERKRGARPVNPTPAGYTGHQSWTSGAAAIEAWCDSGDSDELARLRAELAQQAELLRAAKGLYERLAICEDDRDTEKARADSAETSAIDSRAIAEREHQRTIEQRDKYHDAADELAYSIADVETIGEHSSANNPWEMAIEALETERLRAKTRIAELETEAQEEKVDAASLRGQIDRLFAELVAAREELRIFTTHELTSLGCPTCLSGDNSSPRALLCSNSWHVSQSPSGQRLASTPEPEPDRGVLVVPHERKVLASREGFATARELAELARRTDRLERLMVDEVHSHHTSVSLEEIRAERAGKEDR